MGIQVRERDGSSRKPNRRDPYLTVRSTPPLQMHLHRITQCSLKKVDTLELLRHSSPSAEGQNRVSQNCTARELWPVAGSSAVRVTPIPQYRTVGSVRTVRITGAGTSAGTCRFRRWDMHSALIDAVLMQSSPSTGIPGYAQFRSKGVENIGSGNRAVPEFPLGTGVNKK